MTGAVRYLLCTDLDRTLLPNGSAPESPGARELFARLVARPEVTLAYVSGRHGALVRAAMEAWSLPTPDYVIGDVGTSIWSLEGGQWQAWDRWAAHIAGDWAGQDHARLAALFSDLPGLSLQEPVRQGPFKLSYCVPRHDLRLSHKLQETRNAGLVAAGMPRDEAEPDLCVDALLETMQWRLSSLKVRAALIWSLDESREMGLLDVLPRRATKRHAVEFLMEQAGFDRAHTVFSGDSGNDLPVLVSPLRAVLVANADAGVRQQALEQVQAQGHSDTLYLARGGLLGMNGNYGAGILEGFVHYVPEAAGWLQ